MSFDIRHAFPGKESDEAVFVFARPFPVAFLSNAVIFLFIIVFALLAQLSVSLGWFIGLTDSIANALVLVIGLFELFAVIVFLTAILDFYYDIILVTDRRLVDINQEQVFYRSISELNLEDVEDVNSSVDGFLQTFFDYGTVTVQTAGEHENFIAKNFRHPRQIAAIVSDLSKQAKNGITESARMPVGQPIGVVNNTQMHTFRDLAEAGAVNNDDPRANVPGVIQI